VLNEWLALGGIYISWISGVIGERKKQTKAGAAVQVESERAVLLMNSAEIPGADRYVRSSVSSTAIRYLLSGLAKTCRP